jgi:hypothetical protein
MRAVALVRGGKPITTAAVELNVSATTIHNGVRQDQIDRGERPGITTPESIELAKAKKRIWQLEEEVEILKITATLLGVSSPGYYRYEHRPLSPTRMRWQWLTGLIREIHTASRQTYGSRRVHAELTLGMGVRVSERLVAVLMSQASIAGLPGPAKVKRLHGVATTDDLVHRKFHRLSPNELWVTDITEHPTTWFPAIVRLDLANAIFDYIEIFYNRQRRNSQLGYSTPIEHELRFNQTSTPAWSSNENG